MRRAIMQAHAAAHRGEVPVGALIYDPASERVITGAGNSPIALCDPTAHAEILALRTAAGQVGNYRITGMWLYVTLEPCVMCAGAISLARVGRLIYGAPDPKGGAVAHGPRWFEQPTCHWRPDIKGGVLADACSIVLKDFFKARRESGA